MKKKTTKIRGSIKISQIKVPRRTLRQMLGKGK